jgi:transmembrane sensor
MTRLLEFQATPRTAAEWFAARQGRRDESLERRFAQWLSADPRNADEYALCDLTWELSRDAAFGVGAEPAANSRRWMLASGLVTAACAALVAVVLYLRGGTQPLELTTRPGEQRIVMLADGSQVTLNTRSSLEVRLDRTLRELRLIEGEAFFVVAKDPDRPFVVETSLGSARAVGTRFNVLALGDRVEVVTEEGKVLVQNDGASGAVIATPGVRATLVPGGAAPVLDAADLTRIENWRAQRLEFDRVPLAAALAEISRYTTRPVRAGTADIGRTEISAVLKIGDLDALRATLQGAFGLELQAVGDAWVVREPQGADEGAGRGP